MIPYPNRDENGLGVKKMESHREPFVTTGSTISDSYFLLL